jgi:hypothetical protein
MKVTKNLVLPPALGVYVYLFRPQTALEEGKPPRYSIVLLYDKKERAKLQPLMDAVLAVAEEKWPGKGKDIVQKMRYPVIADGDARYPGDELFRGKIFVRASTQADPARRPPQVVGPDPKVSIVSDEEAYSGCIFRVSVRLFPFAKGGNIGVGVGLNNVQVLQQGGRLDGRKSAATEFAEYSEGDGEQAGSDLL